MIKIEGVFKVNNDFRILLIMLIKPSYIELN